MALLGVESRHRAALEYDWRTRFHVRYDVPDGMSWGEAWRLMGVLAADPSSRLGAALAGWEFPVSREWLALADLYDAFVAANTAKGKHPKPYPRPWGDPQRTTFGKTNRSQEEVRASLRARGHDV